MISISSLVIAAWRVRLILDGEPVDHVAGVAGGIVHRGHPAALLRRGIFQQRAENLNGDVARQQGGQDLVLVRLIFDRGARRSAPPPLRPAVPE